jgi:hypothetical protein
MSKSDDQDSEDENPPGQDKTPPLEHTPSPENQLRASKFTAHIENM